jgi:peptidoglycan/LPS O-acetylase OafA/YrhL
LSVAISHSRRRDPLPQLDGFRGLAIVCVLVEHTFRHSLRIGGVADNLGNVGVILFFTLSGFLITGLLKDEFNRTGTIRLDAFYTRRLLRIVPALYVFLAFIALLSLCGAVPPPATAGYAESAFFFRNLAGHDLIFGHLWSVAIEMQYYLFWPWVFLIGTPNGAWRAAWFLLGAVICWRTWAVLSHRWEADAPVLYLRTDYRLDAVMAGSIIALTPRNVARGRVFRAASHPAIAGILLFAWSENALLSHFVAIRSQWITGQVALGAILLRQCVYQPGGPFARFCAAPWLRQLGQWSYSIYLWQQLFLVIDTPNWGPLRRFPVDIVLTFVAALASRHLVERPCLRLKAKWN